MNVYEEEVLATAGLVGLWDLGVASGNATNLQGGGLPGVVSGSPGRAEPSILPGGKGKSMKFSVGNFVQVADAAALDLGDTWTMEAWVKVESGASHTTQNIMSKGNGSYYLRLIDEGSGYKAQALKSQVANLAESTTTQSKNTVYHIVATKSGETRKVYVNGVDVTKLLSNSESANTGTALVFGQTDAGFGGGELEGWMQYPAVYNTALSKATVEAHYKAGEATENSERKFSTSPESLVRLAPWTPLTASGHTLVAIVKYEEDGNVLGVRNEAKEVTNGPQLAINLGNMLAWGGTGVATMKPPKGSWCLMAASKVAGTAKPRFYIYDFTTKTWTRTDGSEERAEGTPANWKSVQVGGKYVAVGPYAGAVSVAAVYRTVLTDDQLEVLAALPSLDKWLTLSVLPVSMWDFKQNAVTQIVRDLAGEADQTERVETTILSEAPPIPYEGGVDKVVKVAQGGGVVSEARRWVYNGKLIVPA